MEDLRLLGPLIRLGGLCGADRLQTIDPYWIGVPPIQRPPITLEDLEILVALARAENIDDAVERSGVARRTFYRRLARLRAGLNLPPATHGTRIEELMTSMITALTRLGQSLPSGDATSPRADRSGRLPTPLHLLDDRLIDPTLPPARIPKSTA